MRLEIQYYQTSRGEKPFVRWFENLDDWQKVRIDARLSRVEAGNLGDVRSVRNGVLELRIDWGPGYRVYIARRGNFVILLCAGDKRTQQRDIQRAKTYLEDHEARVRNQTSARNGT